MTSFTFSHSLCLAEGRFSQLIIDFPTERPFEYKVNEIDNSLTFTFENTLPSELEELETYDERLIKRVFIKEINGHDTQVKLVFKDRSVRALISQYHEPFRVAIDLFDKNYNLNKDPITGLPLASIGDLSNNAAPIQSQLVIPQNPTSIEASDISVNNEEDFPNNIDNKRKLLQPTPEEIFDISHLQNILSTIPEGRAKHWAEFPPYVYPIQTAVYKGRENPSGYLKKINSQSMSNGQVMAEHGLKLFSFGHELQSLVAYQQVLHKEPSIFDKDPLHNWAFAEIHLGQGNFTLANGYFSNLISKHPDSNLAKFARLRKLDIKAIQYTQNGNNDQLKSLVPELDQIRVANNAELSAQIEIRKAYWLSDNNTTEKQFLPKTNMDIINKISANLPDVESQKTAFMAASIIAKNLIKDDIEWKNSNSEYLGDYFKKYSGPGSEPYLSNLKDELKTRLKSLLVNLENEKKYIDVINIFSSLPKSMQSIKKFPDIAWSIGESYRNLGELEKSLEFYQNLAEQSETSSKKIKSLFWAATISAQLSKNTGRQAKKHSNEARKFDKSMANTWSSLNSDEKNQFIAEYKNEIEKTVFAPYTLKTPSILALQSKELQFGTQASSSVNPLSLSADIGPAHDIKLLSKLAQKFTTLGLNKERVKSLELLKNINPSTIKDNDQAKSVWTNELLSLAEEHRKNNEYLEAGRLYTFTAQTDMTNENRAESLYKGGLLLYRAGKKSEAIEAFTAASEDGNNLFYANLAKERLSQLQE